MFYSFNGLVSLFSSSHAGLLHGLIADLLDQHQDGLLHLFTFSLAFADLALHLLQDVPQHLVELRLGLRILLRKLSELFMHFLVLSQKFLMYALYSFLSGLALLLQAFPYLGEVSGERLLYFFDAVGSFFCLSFDEVSEDGAFLIDEPADPGIRGAALLDVLVDHLQSHFFALLGFFPDGSIGFEVIVGEFLADLAELNSLDSYNMLQLAVLVAETDHDRFQLLLQIADLAIQGVQLALSLGLLAYLEAVYLFGEHQHAVLSERLCWVRGKVRW